MPIEYLLEIPVIIATKTPTQLRRAPAAVTVVTREDIERYGYRTLTDVLARVPEVQTHFHGYTTEADFRGFWSAQAGNRRVLYLLNGQRLNDAFYNGDFAPDVVGDLTNVERIEVMRGPGAALYGSVAVLGVVNVITRAVPEARGTEGEVSAAADDLGVGSSFTQRYQVDVRHRFDETFRLAAHLYWFDEDFSYDTGTGGYARAWNSSVAESPGVMRFHGRPFFSFRAPGPFEDGRGLTGATLPNGTLAFSAGDWTLGGYIHSRRASFVWPLANATFGHPDAARTLGVATAYVEWAPRGRLERWDLKSRVAYGATSTQTDLDFSNRDFLLRPDGTPQISLARRLGLGFNLDAFIGPEGQVYKLGSGIPPAALAPEEIDARGGGLQNHYHSHDTALTFEVQASPVKTARWLVSGGGNYARAEYVNPLWNSYRDGTFLGWHPLGGISTHGHYYGAWGQAIWTPSEALTVTAGARFDRQVIADARYRLGRDRLLYRRVGTAPPYRYEPMTYPRRTATDLTPRLALDWSFRPRSSLRLVYAEAFRAVAPDEIVRLPPAAGDADSEKTRNYEAILSLGLRPSLNVTLNAFHLTGNVLYGGNFNFETRAFQYDRGSGWSNTGASLVAQYRDGRATEAWLHATRYVLRKPTNFFSFVRDYKVPDTPPLPRMEEPLDSATLLVKAGASRRLGGDTTVAAQMRLTGPVRMLAPVNQNLGDPSPTEAGQPNFVVHRTPRSFVVDLSLRHELRRQGLGGAFVAAGVRDLLDDVEWGVLTQDDQVSWDSNTYARPNQLPGLGRRLYVEAGYRF